MPSGPKKRKAARNKKTQGNNQSSFEEDSSSKLESIHENTTMPAVDDGLDSNNENTSLSVVEENDDQLVGQSLSVVEENDDQLVGQSLSVVEENDELVGQSLSVVEETDELVGVDHGEVLNSNNENLVVEAGMGLSCVDDSVVVVQEYVQTSSQNMYAHQISEQLEGLKKMIFEQLCEVDKMRTTLHELLDGLTKVQQIIFEQY